jgi:hypothetical protein
MRPIATWRRSRARNFLSSIIYKSIGLAGVSTWPIRIEIVSSGLFGAASRLVKSDSRYRNGAKWPLSSSNFAKIFGFSPIMKTLIKFRKAQFSPEIKL